MPRRKKEETAPALETGLVRVYKGSEYLDVHPTTLADHKRLGWQQED